MIGFDYGTSNCAVAAIIEGKPTKVSLGEHGNYMASTLYAPSRDIIASWLHTHLPATQKANFATHRQLQLQRGQGVLRELNYDGIDTELLFGQAALNQYLQEPDEGYYIKSPKSFLGASGLKPQQISLFEDIVTAMMSHIKVTAEHALQKDISQTVIGKPVNFQGLNSDESNRQALNILTTAAKRVGFKSVEFQYEPVAAGFEYEASLTKETCVLVVDIGGGTTDCSVQLMSPKFQQSIDRTAHLLGHSGQRIGGNDLDIQLTLKSIMPLLGVCSSLKSGKPVPVNSYWQAAAINDISAQTNFYTEANGRYLAQLKQDCAEPEVMARLVRVYHERLSYQLVNSAEQAKIALTNHDEVNINLSYLEANLSCQTSPSDFSAAIARELAAIAQLMQDAVAQAQRQPDVIFVTGGTANSPVLRSFLQQQFPETRLVNGDNFGSVTAGLARHASKIFA